MTTSTQTPPSVVHIPETVSPQAQAFLRTLTDPVPLDWPAADDVAGWKELQADCEAIYGAGSGGGLAAAAVLKMRDQGLGMPAASVLLSPWLDVTASGDTETTLRDADPNFPYHAQSAAAYADPKDQKDPYASPVYGDFSKGFPPTLIQGGLKETSLSGFVRFYQALDVAGVPVKLDLYEGMISGFQGALKRM